MKENKPQAAAHRPLLRAALCSLGLLLVPFVFLYLAGFFLNYLLKLYFLTDAIGIVFLLLLLAAVGCGVFRMVRVFRQQGS